MLDPVTLSAAVTGATTAYNAIKKAIMVGKEIEDMSSELSKWMTAVSDVDNVHRNANSPSALDRVFNGSIEQVAIESFSARKKLAKQREELRNFLVANYGTSAWDDLLREEGRIRKARQEVVYARDERNRQIRDYTIIGITSLVGFGSVAWILWIVSLSF
jgi:hypothetical protein